MQGARVSRPEGYDDARRKDEREGAMMQRDFSGRKKGGLIVKTAASILVLCLLWVLPAVAGTFEETDFEVKTTEDLIDLCSAPPEHPLYAQAMAFCHGYLVGAYQYYEAESSGPKGIKLVNMPNPPPTRNEAIKMFVEWAKAHPQYMKEKPVETEFRFLMEKWPCKP